MDVACSTRLQHRDSADLNSGKRASDGRLALVRGHRQITIHDGDNPAFSHVDVPRRQKVQRPSTTQSDARKRQINRLRIDSQIAASGESDIV